MHKRIALQRNRVSTPTVQSSSREFSRQKETAKARTRHQNCSWTAWSHFRRYHFAAGHVARADTQAWRIGCSRAYWQNNRRRSGKGRALVIVNAPAPHPRDFYRKCINLHTYFHPSAFILRTTHWITSENSSVRVNGKQTRHRGSDGATYSSLSRNSRFRYYDFPHSLHARRTL